MFITFITALALFFGQSTGKFHKFSFTINKYTNLPLFLWDKGHIQGFTDNYTDLLLDKFTHRQVPLYMQSQRDHVVFWIGTLSIIVQLYSEMSLTLIWYQEMVIVWAFDIATIDCVIGQIKISNCWGIIS